MNIKDIFIRFVELIFSINIEKRFTMSNQGFYQNQFKPKNPQKCVNLTLVESFKGIPSENLKKDSFGKYPFARSSYENRMFTWLDNNKNVLSWGSEVIQCQYINMNDKKIHRYWVDIYMEMKNSDGITRKYIIEIKPKKKLTPPKLPKNKTRKAMANYDYAMAEFIQNKSKWDSAKLWGQKHGMIFDIVTEEQLFTK